MTSSFFLTELLKAEGEYKGMEVPREKEIASYYRLRQQLSKLGKEFKDFITKPKYIVPFLQPGRMVHVRLTQPFQLLLILDKSS